MGQIRRLVLWACLSPLLLIVAVGVRDFASAFFDQRKLAAAAFEGSKRGRDYGLDADKIREAAQTATSLTDIVVSLSRPCGCPAANGVALAQCDASCPDGGWSQPYIVIVASMCFRPVFHWPGLAYCSPGNTQCVAARCGPRQILIGGQSVEPQ